MVSIGRIILGIMNFLSIKYLRYTLEYIKGDKVLSKAFVIVCYLILIRI